jgi:hypothetical protein
VFAQHGSQESPGSHLNDIGVGGYCWIRHFVREAVGQLCVAYEQSGDARCFPIAASYWVRFKHCEL